MEKEEWVIYIPYKCAARPTACMAEVLQSALNFSDERHYKNTHKIKQNQGLCLFISWGKKNKSTRCKMGLPKDLVSNSESRGGINAEFNLILLFLFTYLFFKEYLFIWLPWVLSFDIWTFSCGMWDLIPWPGIEPRPLVLGAWSL